ncbi:spermidine hydroxycinnamoyl transferase [Arachis duranensis]|uniref:Spermidine hydroxycinnamoyl transferase n=1 Tax=Arachis duranensis TaxID=130453 RepID=A0A6P4DY69_ARADU|nr:spermidine hydroxycinnamoyl transferase [Arachis duranensis]
MVSIQSHHTIIPSNPTPNEKLFSLCEQIKLRTHAPLLYAYNKSTVNNHVLVATFMSSLSKALSIYYPLAGRLSLIDGSRWEIICNAKGALLIEAACNGKTMHDFCGDDFVPTGLVSQLIPNIDYGTPVSETPLLAVQITRFNCGGFTIGVALCRAAIDGTATMRFMNTWAKLAKGESLDPYDQFPCYDPSLLNSRTLLRNSKKVLHDHSEELFGTPPPWLGPLRKDSRVVVEVVKLTKEQVKKLKTKAAINNVKTPFSSFEVISGLLWRCVTKARYQGNGDQPTRLTTLVNCRNRLKPPLPNAYAGNAVFPTVTTTCSFSYLMQNPLSSAVEKVKKAIAKVDDEFVRNALVYIGNAKDMDLVRYNIHYPAKSVHKGGFKGNPNLFVVSWMNFSYKEATFGFGEPVHFGPGFMDSEGKAFITNNASGDGFNVAIALDSSHMDAFKKLFFGEIEEVFPISKL